MSLAFHLRCAGLLLILLGLAHAGFSKHLNWSTELRRLSTVNRQVFLVHCFYIAFLLVMVGLVSLLLTPDLLVPSPLARAFFGANTLVWGTRLYIQWFVFDRSLWREDRFNRRVHNGLTFLWIYLTAVNGSAFWRIIR
jgi:hypothetical protein